MRSVPILILLALALGTASAASVAYSIEPGDCEVYFVPGSLTTPPTIDNEQGDVEVVSVLFIPADQWRVELCCADTSPETCEGYIRT